MFTENLPGPYGASLALPEVPLWLFHNIQQKRPTQTNQQITKHRRLLLLPLDIYIFVRVLFIRSVNVPLFSSRHQRFRANMIPSRLWGRILSQPAFWLISLSGSETVHVTVCHPLMKKRFHTLVSMQGNLCMYLRKFADLWADESRLFCSRVPLPLISSDSTRRALNRPLSLYSPSSYRQKGGNHDSPFHSVLLLLIYLSL